MTQAASHVRSHARALPTRLALAGAALALATASPAAHPLAAQAPATSATPVTQRAALVGYDVDRAHSEINFTAASRLLDAHGFFGKWDADVQIDPAALERSTVRLVIDAASINTRIDRRDNHLRSADFFDVANHPTITFVSTAMTRTGPSAGTVTGDLTVRGVTKTMTIPVTIVFYENGRGRFRGTFPIKRREFGVSYQSNLNPIEDVVEVQFNMSVAEKKS
jgi:polyisoprenoid-binding protein YceI